MCCRAVLLCSCLLAALPAQAQGPLLAPPTPPDEVAPGLPVPQAEPEVHPQPQPRPEYPALPQHPLTEALNQEMKDIAGAIRALDQSYYIRGYQSRKAWTAGSAFFDWKAQGLTPPPNPRVLPPPPINLSRCQPKTPPCPDCQPGQPPCPHCQPNQPPCRDCQKLPAPAPEGVLQQSCRDCAPTRKRGCGQIPFPSPLYSGYKLSQGNPLPSCESCGPATPAACPNCITTVSYKGGRKCVQTFSCADCQRN